jgi:acetoin utilization deacetylase AcuC-like enzyme
MDDLVYFYPEGHALHYQAFHPERPERVEVIRVALQQAGWWDGYPKLPAISLTDDILHNIHSKEYLNLLEISCRRSGYLDADTYLKPASWNLARLSAGGAAAVAQAVWRRQVKFGFALTRPPGHHAMRGQGMGFCLLNNVALAAEHLIQNENAQRLAIVDLDLHHGNGTQDIFWQRGDVFYISTHQSPLYPGSGAINEIGEGAGEGKNANFPLPPRSGDTAFMTIMEELIVPLLVDYRPEMILISYGFDTHWSDPLGQLLLSADGYQKLIKRLITFADEHCLGRLALFLEGGYNLDAGAACSRSIVSTLLNKNEADLLGPASVVESSLWRNMLDRAHQIWGI